MAVQPHHSGEVRNSGNLFYTMPYAPAGETHVINNEKQTIHLPKRRIIKTRRCRTFVSEELLYTI